MKVTFETHKIMIFFPFVFIAQKTKIMESSQTAFSSDAIYDFKGFLFGIHHMQVL